MVIQNAQQIKNQILSFLQSNGPSLPVQIGKSVNQNTMFTGAFLSELLSERKIKLSNMRIGGSYIYLLPGQESQLENFENFLKGKEKEAFMLLKEKRVLLNENQLPPIRVALQSLKDFAIPQQHQGKMFWRYFLHPESGINIASLSEIPQVVEIPSIISQTSMQSTIPLLEIKKEDIIQSVNPFEGTPIQEPPVLQLETSTITTEKENIINPTKDAPPFIQSIHKFLEKNQLDLLEEKTAKKKEFFGVVRMHGQFGKTNSYLAAKEKKKFTEKDLEEAYSQSLKQHMPLIFLSPGMPDKKAEVFLEKHKNLVKFRQI